MTYGVAALYEARGGSLRRLQQFVEHAPDLLRPDEQLVLFLNTATRAAISVRECTKIRVVVLPARGRGYLARTLNEQWHLPRLLRRERIDALLSTANTMPLRAGVPCVVLFQNAAPFCPPLPGERPSLPDWVRQALLRRLILLSARRATRLIFLSEFFREVIQEHVASAAARGDVVYVAREEQLDSTEEVALPAALAAGSEGRPLFVVVAHLYPHKNLLRLLEAFVRASRGLMPEPLLVVAGDPISRSYAGRLHARLGEIDADGRLVRVVGGMGRPAVQALLARADVFLFASVCENCPNAVIEALSAGLPIGAARTPVIEEVAGDAAAYFDPYDVEDITRVVRGLMVDASLRCRLRRRAIDRAAAFPSAADVAERLLVSLRGTVENR